MGIAAYHVDPILDDDVVVVVATVVNVIIAGVPRDT